MASILGDAQAGIVAVPYLQDAQSRAYNEVLGDEKSRLTDRTRTGVKLRWPAGPGMQSVAQSVGATLDPTAGDARRLGLIGGGFDLPRLGSMSDAQYESYLESAWSTHQLGGTPAAITNALHAFGVLDVEIVEEWQAMGGSWATPGGYGHRVCVILGPNYGTLGWTPMVSPMPNPLPTAGIVGLTQTQLADLARLIRRWKDAGCTPVKLVFRFTVGGITSPVFGAGGLTSPIHNGPDAVVLYLTGHYFNELQDGTGNIEGLYSPLVPGPVYLLDGSQG